MSTQNYKNMGEIIRKEFPLFSCGQCGYACNLVSRYLRKMNTDIYYVDISNKSFSNEHSGGAYYSWFSVTVAESEVFVRVTVD